MITPAHIKYCVSTFCLPGGKKTAVFFLPLFPASQDLNTDVIAHTHTHRHMRHSTQTHPVDSWVYDQSVIVLAIIDEKYFIKTVAVEMTHFPPSIAAFLSVQRASINNNACQ